MVLLVRHRYSHYRRFLLDIWGVVRLGTMDLEKSSSDVSVSSTDAIQRWNSSHRFPEYLDQGSRRKTRLLLLFYKLWERRSRDSLELSRKYIYRVEPRGPQRLPRYRSPTFLAVRLVRLFYLTYNFRQLRRLVLGAHRKLGFYEENLAFALEGRLMCFLYRTGFVSSFFSSIDFIRSFMVFLNNALEASLHHIIKIGDLLTFDDLGRALIYVRLLKRLRKGGAFFPYAPYLFVSYNLLCAYYLRPPRMRELIFPVRIDVHAVVNYFGGRK